MNQESIAKTLIASPYLEGIFTPLKEERTEYDLKTEGEIPSDLNGSLIFNASNPAYKPKSFYSWFDGDGMVHSTSIENGKAKYINKFVKTKGFLEEQKKGKPIWDGIIGKIDETKEHGNMKDSSNTAIVRYNDILLSVWYLSGRAYRLDPNTMETMGEYDFGGNLKDYMAAHTKLDPRTGELVFFNYNLYKPPYMNYGVIGKDNKVHFTPIHIKESSYCHDIAITKNYSILIDLPLSWKMDSDSGKKQRRFLEFNQNRPARFGVIPRLGTDKDIRWFEANPCYMFHVVNSYEENNKIILYGCRIDNPMPEKPNSRAPKEGTLSFAPVFHKWEFDLTTGNTKEEQLDEVYAEFPRINDEFAGEKYRYSYHGRFTPGVILQDAFIKYDRETNTKKIFEMPTGLYANEPVYVKSEKSNAEDGGYLLSYISTEKLKGQVWIFSASSIEKGPIGKIHLPERLPPVFHGTWINRSN
ncbi:MAG: carotenoid oxygenase family protein [Leptospiraceae bacterium]|nr:carotenoid oxygenase family protein [Leptospiraceae bacterium]